MEIYEEIKKFEESIYEGFPLLSVFRICKYKSLVEQINTIERELPQEILQNRVNLIKRGQGEIFKYIEAMQELLEKSFKLFDSYVVIETGKLFNLIDLIYAELPASIANARGKQNETKNKCKGENFELCKEIEIPDFLKKDS